MLKSYLLNINRFTFCVFESHIDIFFWSKTLIINFKHRVNSSAKTKKSASIHRKKCMQNGNFEIFIKLIYTFVKSIPINNQLLLLFHLRDLSISLLKFVGGDPAQSNFF